MKQCLFLIFSLLVIAGCQMNANPEENVEEKISETSAAENEDLPEKTEQPEEMPMETAEVVEFDTASGFVRLKDVIPNLIEEPRYATAHNFTGQVVEGYEEPIVILSNEAARALQLVNQRANELGYYLKVFDGYRPARAVQNFIEWSYGDDERMKEEFYPNVDKSLLFSSGYLSEYSYHSLGSTVDLTLVDAKSGREVNMGTGFDFLDPASHPDDPSIGEEAYENRMLLRELMMEQGFVPISTEWWHFQLEWQPYQSAFDFPVSQSSIYWTTE